MAGLTLTLICVAAAGLLVVITLICVAASRPASGHTVKGVSEDNGTRDKEQTFLRTSDMIPMRVRTC